MKGQRSWKRKDGEAGQIEAALLFVFLFIFQVFIFRLSGQLAAELSQNYRKLETHAQFLNSSGPVHWEAWGLSWPDLPPRIDFGAYSERGKDAEAICYFVRLEPSLNSGKTWLCE